MKKSLYRLAAFILIIILLTTAFTGCRTGDDGRDDEGFVYVPEITSLSSLAVKFPNISNVTLTENALYFTSGTSLFNATQIVRVDLDLSDIKNLSNYSVLSGYITAPPPHDAEGGGTFIDAMQIDNDGNLWVAERSRYFTYDFPPDFDLSNADESEIFDHSRLLDAFYKIRKLDSTGAEILTIEINRSITTNPNWAGISAFYADGDGNIFIGSGQTIYIFDSNGNTLFNLSTEWSIFINSIIRLSDGSVAHFGWIRDHVGAKLWIIDIERKNRGNEIQLPDDTTAVFHGNDEYLVVIMDQSHLSAIDKENNETVQILNWADSGIIPYMVNGVLFLPDNRILLANTTYTQDASGSVSFYTDLILFNKISSDEVHEKTVITVCTFTPYHILNVAVAEFNKTSALYKVEIIELDFDYDIDKLALEMMTGDGPDILLTGLFPFHQWAGRGFFTDLYEFIDADPRLNRSDLVESVLRGYEINGKLYNMSPDFAVHTIVGHPDVLGSSPGWDFDEFKAVLDANPQASLPLGERIGGANFLTAMVDNDITRFVDWDVGAVYFDTDSFIELLELAYILEKRIKNERQNTPAGSHNTSKIPELISSGEQIMELAQFRSFWMYTFYQELFGGDFVFKGYPTESGSGNSFGSLTSYAITSTSKNQQGAWEFIRMLLSEEWQSIQYYDGFLLFPTNKKVFDQSLNSAMEENVMQQTRGWLGLTIEVKPLSQGQVDTIRWFVDSASGLTTYTNPLYQIIWENLEDFFNDMITAQAAAQRIQSRASRFVSEQSR